MMAMPHYHAWPRLSPRRARWMPACAFVACLLLAGCSSNGCGGTLGGGELRLGAPSLGVMGPQETLMQPNAQVITERYIVQPRQPAGVRYMEQRLAPAPQSRSTFAAPCD